MHVWSKIWIIGPVHLLNGRISAAEFVTMH